MFLGGVRKQVSQARALLEASAAQASQNQFDPAYRAALESRNLLFHATRGLAAARGEPMPEMPVVGVPGGGLGDHAQALEALGRALGVEEDMQMGEHLAAARMPYARYLGWVRDEVANWVRSSKGGPDRPGGQVQAAGLGASGTSGVSGPPGSVKSGSLAPTTKTQGPTRFTIKGRLLLGTRFAPGAVIVEGGRIVRIVEVRAHVELPNPIYDATYVVPGLIDMQVNGGFGVSVEQGADAIGTLGAKLPSHGVTAFLPTLVTSSPQVYQQVLESWSAIAQDGGARPLGLHLEGPLLSPGRAGAHSEEFITPASAKELEALAYHEAVRMVTLAPERPDAYELIGRLVRRGVLVSLGHTSARYDELIEAIDAGAEMVTHLYNAMSPFHHRAPGAVGAALLDERVTVGLIIDGVHSHPAAARLALRCKGVERIALVSDAVAAAGMGAGTYSLGGKSVVVDKSAARLPDGTLSGSVLTLDQAVRNAIELAEFDPAQAFVMASEVPARILGLTKKGRITTGYDADLVLLDETFQVQKTLIAGNTAYERPA